MIRRLVQLVILSFVATTALVASVPEKRTATMRLELWVLAALAGALLLHLTRNRLPLTPDPLARPAKPEVPPGEPYEVETLAIAFALAPSTSERVRRSAQIQLRDALRIGRRTRVDARGAALDARRVVAAVRRAGGLVTDAVLTSTLRAAHAVLDEVERAVVGKRDVLELVLMGFLADGHVLLDDLPGVAKTLMARSFAAATGLVVPADPVHTRPAALGHHRRDAARPAHPDVQLSAGSALRQPRARRRGEPRAGEDPGRVARGDAGATGDRRWHHLSARAAVPRRRDAEPDRVRGHLPAARGPARPIHPAHRGRLSVAGRRVEPAGSTHGARHRRSHARLR